MWRGEVVIDDKIFQSRLLLNVGVAAYADGNDTLAEACFQESKRLASSDPADPTIQTARLYLATVFCTRNLPGKFKDEAEAIENAKWLDFAEVEYREVLAGPSHAREKRYAARRIMAIRRMRAMDSNTQIPNKTQQNFQTCQS